MSVDSLPHRLTATFSASSGPPSPLYPVIFPLVTNIIALNHHDNLETRRIRGGEPVAPRLVTESSPLLPDLP